MYRHAPAARQVQRHLLVRKHDSAYHRTLRIPRPLTGARLQSLVRTKLSLPPGEDQLQAELRYGGDGRVCETLCNDSDWERAASSMDLAGARVVVLGP